MPSTDRLTIKARVRVAILALVVTIVLSLSFLHVYGVAVETIDDSGDRARLVAEQVKTYLLATANRVPQGDIADQDENARRQQWYAQIRSDVVLPRVLQNGLVQSRQVVEVAIFDERQRVLASTDASSIGGLAVSAREFSEWQNQSLGLRLKQILEGHEDYALSLPLGTGQGKPVVTIRVLISAALMRASVLPLLKELATVCLGSLVLSILLAVVVSNLISNSLARISKDLDRIASGEIPPKGEPINSPELSDVHSKLALIGHQFRGAREEFSTLKSNVDQLLKSVEEAVFVFGPDGRLQMAGEPALRLLGRNRSELMGRSVGEVFPKWTSLGSTIAKQAARNAPMRDAIVTFERPNLEPVKLLMNLEPIDCGDRHAGLLVMLRDAESRSKLRSHLDTAYRLSAISRLTAGVAHEVKNPLNAMMLHVELAADKERAGASPKFELDTIKSELGRLDRVLKTFLDFSKPLEFRLGECDLRMIATEAAGALQTIAAERGVKVGVKADTAPPSVRGDCELLRECIRYIAQNAVEASGKDGLVEIVVEVQDGQTVIRICDEGDGIPPEIQDRIYNLYFTTKPNGSGMGLALAFRVVQFHGGSITFSSDVGKGTEFKLSFPSMDHEAVGV